jgi:hypothetical protein
VKDNSAFFAYDNRKWMDILKSTFVFCLDALEEIAVKKKQSHFNKELQVSDRLLLLAAKTSKLVFKPIYTYNNTCSKLIIYSF